MTVRFFKSLITVLSIRQGRKQASYCRASDVKPSRRGRRWSLPPEEHISITMFSNQDRTRHVPKRQRRRYPLGSSIQFP
jgi:hypothetical protein